MPSRLLRWLLQRLLGATEQDALGDLEEESRQRGEAGRSRLAAEVWYVREAISLLFGIIRHRLWQMCAHQAPSPGGAARGGIMAGTGRDLAHAVRSLLRDPVTTFVIAVTLAVAVGATTAIFSVTNAAFLRPLPYPEADRLVRIYTGFREDPQAAFAVSPLDWRDFDAFEPVVEASGVWSLMETVHMTDGDRPVRLVAPRASASLFRILGAEPVVGRFFTPEETVPGQDDAVVLSHGLWVRAFGADPEVVGRSVTMDERSYRVVGVAPEQGMLPSDADVWLPLALGPEWYLDERWGWQFLGAVARLTPGTDLGSATRALNARLARANPQRANDLGQTRVVRSLHAERSRTAGSAILMLLAAVGLVLAMACANVMNVMLARSEVRMREFGLRRALGSGAGPLARLVLLETLLFAGLGGAGGLVIARFGLGVLAKAELDAIADLGTIGLELPVLLFGLLLTVATAGLFGAAPLLGALRADPQSILKETASRAGASRVAARVRNGLVVVQVAMALTLLVAVGLSARAFTTLVSRDPGFDPEGVLTATIELPRAYSGPERSTFYRLLMERLSALPGVASAGAANFLPLEGLGWSSSIEIVNPSPSVTDPDPGGNMRAVSSDYFTAVGIPLVEGRVFTESDDPDARPVVVVDETMARLFWPDGSPVGRQVIVGGLSQSPASIVGVVGNVPDESLSRPGPGHVYFPILQSPQRRVSLVLKTNGDPAALAPAMREAIRTLEPRIPISDEATYETRIRESLAGPRIGLILLVVFGAAAALLAAVGIYGVLAYTVARRTGEIGTRIALGATPVAVLGSIVRQAMHLWLMGAAVGVIGAMAVGEVLGSYVAGADAPGMAAYAGAASVLGVVALFAASLPAHRATRVDPVEALRSE